MVIQRLWILVELKLTTNMKRKYAICLMIVGVVLFVFVGSVLADYASDYQNYVNQTGVYQIDYNNYLTARANYLASGSLDSQDKAKSATLKMLQSRDNLVIAYLAAVRSKVNSLSGMSDVDKGSLTNLIGAEIDWYTAHNVKLASSGSLSDLIADSDEAKQQFSLSTTTTIYLSLIDLGIGMNNYIRGELNGEIGTLQAKIGEIKANQDKDVSSIERSLVDVQNKISRSQDKDNTARDLVSAIKPGSNDAASGFSSAQTAVSDANSYLKEANQGLLQIVTQIKTN